MKARIIKFAGACFFALAGHVLVDASPTFSESCFETEEKAKARQSVYQSREVDNSKSTEMDKLARALVGVQDVELSELKSILGESKITSDETTNVIKHEWQVTFYGSPSASHVRYEPSRGYCVSTRRGGIGVVNFIWKTESYDKTHGTLMRFQSYF